MIELAESTTSNALYAISSASCDAWVTNGL